MDDLTITLTSSENTVEGDNYDLDKIIFDLDSQLKLLTSQADQYDYLMSIGSGILCSTLDIVWGGDFNLMRGRARSSDAVDDFVVKTAQLLGCKDTDITSAVGFLEKRFPLASDGNTPAFGGGLQHHLRDFAHHPTLVGLVFSLLTQFTGKSYGTDVHGCFLVVDVPEKSRIFIGEDVPSKIIQGTIIWFFHLVSDMAGSSGTAGITGGTGIPGPILSLAKEVSAIPFFRNINVDGNSLSKFLSKLFNGTLLAKHDQNGKIIKESVLKFDLRGELGIAVELSRQAVPVVANECIVRLFYFLRRFCGEIQRSSIRTIEDLKLIDWESVMPTRNATISRMLTISTGVFTTIDIGESIVTQKLWLSVNYAGIGRFAIAIGQDVSWCLRARDVKKIREMYEKIKQSTFCDEDSRIYERIGDELMDSADKLGLTLEQTEILYNIEYYKTLNDVQHTQMPIGGDKVRNLKAEWGEEWKSYMTEGFSAFLHIPDAKLHWYSLEELHQKIEQNRPAETWFKLVLLEAMLFEPYYTLSLERDKRGREVPSKKYNDLKNPITGYKQDTGDKYLESEFSSRYSSSGYVKRLRKCHNTVTRELNEVMKAALKAVGAAAIIAVASVATVGAFAPQIAVFLVGSNFAGLHGIALANACLAYLGGGAVAAGGMGMAGGTMAIVGGGTVLGLGAAAGVGGVIGAAELLGRKNTIVQSAKLLVSVREIFLNDEHDIAYSNTVYEQYVQKIAEIEKDIVDLKLKADVAGANEKKELRAKIKNAEETVEAMRIARKSMNRFISSFQEGAASGN